MNYDCEELFQDAEDHDPFNEGHLIELEGAPSYTIQAFGGTHFFPIENYSVNINNGLLVDGEATINGDLIANQGLIITTPSGVRCRITLGDDFRVKVEPIE